MYLTFVINNVILYFMKRILIEKKHQSRNSRRCRCGKLRFRDKTEAVDALHSVRNKAKRSVEDTGTTYRQECRTYRCGLCQGWHLTSQQQSQDPYGRRLAA
jgi:hypothetical protein